MLRLYKTIAIACGALALLSLTSGCSTLQRAAGTTAGGGLGAATTYGLISTSPAGVATGAVVGGVMGGAFSKGDKKELQEVFDDGYIRGNSDAIKKHYWMRQRMEKEQYTGNTVYYQIPIEQETPDGRGLVRHPVTIPIVE